MFAINLGGEGEVPGVLNQQGPWALGPNWFSSRHAKTFKDLVDAGLDFLICSNLSLSLPDGILDLVYTNGVPVDQSAPYGPGVQSSEIQRILKPGGVWYRDGVLYFAKP